MQVQHGDFFAFYFLSVVASLLCGHNSAGRKKVNFLQISCDPREEPSVPQNLLKHPAGEFPISRRKVKTHLRTPICVRIGLEWLWHSSPDCRSPPRGCHRWGNFFAIRGWYIIICYLIMFGSSQSCCDLAPPVSISLQYQSVNHFAGEVKHTAVVLINSRWRNYISFSGDWILDDETSITSWWSSFLSLQPSTAAGWDTEVWMSQTRTRPRMYPGCSFMVSTGLQLEVLQVWDLSLLFFFFKDLKQT